MSAERASRVADDADVIGSVHSFGEDGPAYEVLGLEHDGMASIRVVESGELLSYPVASVRLDPEA